MDKKTGKWEIDCVIYDCDGVMFDSLDANRRLYLQIAQSIGRAPLTEEEVRYCHTHTVYDSLRYMFRENEALEKKAVEFLKKEINFKDFIVYLKMEPNLMETLTALKERGIKRAISTNRTTSMPHLMERYGLSPYFEMVVTALDVLNPKPHPESLEKILKAFNLVSHNVVFIGDSEVDRETALAAGVRFVAYKGGGLEADAAIDDHLALLDFLSNGRRPQE
ncbi:MAG TPA: HAD-IA family hydrolase [Syntrophorhabdaceae bacterium]|nr:HAD-IA family hydrolase [Syntrophorhabdaceae bacterium]HQM80060.1 HAD-IA family hydrolase [Syntrophorhabdaceae bacterium]